MKVVILAGGLGTRLQEVTDVKPKPMVEIGGLPILWHIMKMYSSFGHKDFIAALGYKGEIIKQYFLNYYHLHHDITVHLGKGETQVHGNPPEDWTVQLVNTGSDTMTGGRIKRLAPLLKEGTFLLTYGDGVANVDIKALLEFHKKHGKLATITAVRPPARFGGLVFQEDRVVQFSEKPQIGEGWINGGFFVFEPKVLDYIAGDGTILERDPLETLASEGQLMAYRHDKFWQCMDTLRDVKTLESLWESGKAPWKTWK